MAVHSAFSIHLNKHFSGRSVRALKVLAHICLYAGILPVPANNYRFKTFGCQPFCLFAKRLLRFIHRIVLCLLRKDHVISNANDLKITTRSVSGRR